MQNGQQVICEYFLKVFRFELGSSGHVPGNLLYLHGQWIIGVIGAKENLLVPTPGNASKRSGIPPDTGDFKKIFSFWRATATASLTYSETPMCRRITGTSRYRAASSAITPGDALLDIPV